MKAGPSLAWENRRQTVGLHSGVVGTPSPFRANPRDILARVLDIAGFTVDAVLRVDLKVRFPAVIRDNLIDSGRAVPLCRLGVIRQIDRDRYPGIGKL